VRPTDLLSNLVPSESATRLRGHHETTWATSDAASGAALGQVRLAGAADLRRN